jgi:nucleoside-diphosphate-sugar epimerase
MRCLVTGGCGFIGSHLVCELVDLGHDVVVVDNFRTGRRENLPIGVISKVEVLDLDVRDVDGLLRACAGVDVAFHEAAIAEVPYSFENPEETQAVNLWGTICLVRAARTCGVRRIVLASTSAVYGDTGRSSAVETAELHPASPYAVSKAESESVLRTEAQIEGLDALIFRYFNVYGPRQRPDGAYASVVPRFVWQAIQGEPLTVVGSGEQRRDFIHVSDLVRLKVRLGLDLTTRYSGYCLNAGCGVTSSVNEIAAVVESLLGYSLRRCMLPAREADPPYSVANTDRAAYFGWRPQVDLNSGLRTVLDFMRGVDQ